MLDSTNGQRLAPIARQGRRMPPPMAATSTSDLALVRPVRNLLLGSLSARELASMWPTLEQVTLEVRDPVFEPETPIRHVYFPETAVVSFVSELREGGTIEVGTAGCEGMAGLPIFLGEDRASVRAFIQVPGMALRMDAEQFARLASVPGPFHQTMLRYTLAFLTQVAQTAACNGAHLVEQRCARWLLMTHDRVEGDELALTHEFLAAMLGVRRAGVTVAMHALQDAGLVRQSRGRVLIVDRGRLERASCECYGTVRAHSERLLGNRSPG
jgi:CRP-like cAMP-binding protein